MMFRFGPMIIQIFEGQTMKSKQEIREEIVKVEKEITKIQDDFQDCDKSVYSAFTYIDNKNYAVNKLKALKWVLGKD